MSRRGYRCGGAIPHTNKTFSNAIQKIVDDAEKEHKLKLTLKGPFYCDSNGDYVDAETMANPKYTPHVSFGGFTESSPSGPDGSFAYVYNLAIEDFYARSGADVFLVGREDIPDWIIEEVFKRTPRVHNGSEIGDFSSFTYPLIRKAFPKLITQNLVSVQPMTQPVGGISFYKTRYGAIKGSV